MNRPRFDTSPYELSHGTAPRGRGSWAFVPAGTPDHLQSDLAQFAPVGTLTEAKAWIQATFPEWTSWLVLP